MTWCGIKESTFDRVNKGRVGPDGKPLPGYSWDYVIDTLGYKCYMTDIAAAICLEQMKKLESNLGWRRHIQNRYNNELKDYIMAPEWSETVQHYCARVPKEDRGLLIDFMAAKYVHTSVHFKPLHLHPILKQNRDYPVANDVWQELISLPCHGGMSDQDIDYVVSCIKEYFDKK